MGSTMKVKVMMVILVCSHIHNSARMETRVIWNIATDSLIKMAPQQATNHELTVCPVEFQMKEMETITRASISTQVVISILQREMMMSYDSVVSRKKKVLRKNAMIPSRNSILKEVLASLVVENGATTRTEASIFPLEVEIRNQALNPHGIGFLLRVQS